MDGPLRDPEFPDGEATTYRGLVDGKPLGTGTNRIEHAEIRGRPAYRQLLEMEIDGGVAYRLEGMFARTNGSLIAESYRLVTTHDGEQVALEEGRFRGVKALGWGGEVTAYPRGMNPLLGCAVALRGLEFEKGAEHDVPLWLANSVWWDLHVKVEKLETIELPTGSQTAWRVRARPSFERMAGKLDRLIQLVLPPFHLHFAEEPPHRFLRFEFPTARSRGTPGG